MPNQKSAFQQKIVPLLPFIFIVGIIGIAGIFIYKSKAVTSKALPETEKNTMKGIPEDVKKTMDKQVLTASVSATLHVPILMYHYVEDIKNKRDKTRQLLNVNPYTFEQQIQTLINADYTFITAKDLGDILDGKLPLPKNPVMLTFDDGHWDLDTNVVPVLKKYHVRATAYIIPGFVGTNSDSLSEKQLEDVIASGVIDVGAHTVHHISLKGKSLAQVQDEIDTSKTMLEKQYNIHVYSFAYPYGSFDQQALDVAKQAGFTTAASTIPGNEQNQQNRFFLFRVRPGYMIGQELVNYLNLTWNSFSYYPKSITPVVNSHKASSSAE